MNSLIRRCLVTALLSLATFASAQPVTYRYDGDLLPSEGIYADWFTTVGPGHPTGYYFGHTTWSSDGNVLNMNTSISPSEGIWFGRTSGYGDPSNFNFANTADGNLGRVRLALAPASSEWTFYLYDASGYGFAFDFFDNGFNTYTRSLDTNATLTQFHPVANMTTFHTFTAYVIAGQVSYFFDNSYLGGGAALQGASDFMLIGDASASNVSGYGTIRIDYLELITSVTADPSLISAIPEPSAYALGAGLLALAGTIAVRRTRKPSAKRAVA